MKAAVIHLPIFLSLLLPGMLAAQTKPARLKVEHFDRDSHWDSLNNHLSPATMPTVSQDFGYSPATRHAGGDKGEIGGKVWRSTTPAFYAMELKSGGRPLSFDEPIEISGTLSLAASSSASGAFFGLFSEHLALGGRPMGSFGLHFSGENAGMRVFARAISPTNRSAGVVVAERDPVTRKLPLVIADDGKPHTFKLSYDPKAAGGRGAATLRLDDRPPLTFDLPDGFKNDGGGTHFARFGLLNGQKSGGPMSIYFDNVALNGQSFDFAHDPLWSGSGNRKTFVDRDVTGAQDFGFSPDTHLAGGLKPGELAGAFWRTEGPWAFYADRVGRLTLDEPLVIRGTVAMTVGAPDSGMFIGFFSSNAGRTEARDFVGVRIEGPSRVGHFFAPAWRVAGGAWHSAQEPDHPPVLVPDARPRPFEIRYDPASQTLRATLDGQAVDLSLKRARGEVLDGAHFDRFGVFTALVGGQQVRIAFDDLAYTAAVPGE